MSINFSEDAEHEQITSASALLEDANESSLRPKTLAEYIGQEKAKKKIFGYSLKQQKEETSLLTTSFFMDPRVLARQL